LGIKDELTVETVRKHFPECWAVANAFRDEFGSGVKVNFMSEGGKNVGKSKEGVGKAFALNEIVINSSEFVSVIDKKVTKRK